MRGYLLEPERRFLDLHASATDFLRENVAILNGKDLSADNLDRQFRGSGAAESIAALRATLTESMNRVEIYR